MKENTLSLILPFTSQISFLCALKDLVTLLSTKLYALCSCVNGDNPKKRLKENEESWQLFLILMCRKTYRRVTTITDHLSYLQTHLQILTKNPGWFTVPSFHVSYCTSFLPPRLHPRLAACDAFPMLVYLFSIFSVSVAKWYEVIKGI